MNNDFYALEAAEREAEVRVMQARVAALFDAFDEWRAAHLPLISGAESRLIEAITALRAATADPTPEPEAFTGDDIGGVGSLAVGGLDPDMGSDICPRSRRVDGPHHSFAFWGDDPYVICAFCDEMRDAHTGQVLRDATADPTPQTDTEQ